MGSIQIIHSALDKPRIILNLIHGTIQFSKLLEGTLDDSNVSIDNFISMLDAF